MAQLAACRRAWRDARDRDLPYVQIASWGHDLTLAVGSGCSDPWVHEVFRVIEAAMVSGDPETKNLVVVGMFEAMQGDAYRTFVPPDRLDEWLLPASLAAWRDLIEGWTGKGIRSIEHWKRVIVNGAVDAVRWDYTQSRWDEIRFGGELHWERGHRELSPEEIARLRAEVHPLVALALAAPGPLDDPEVLTIIQGQRSVRIELSGDLGTNGKRWFQLDLQRLHDAWPSRTR